MKNLTYYECENCHTALNEAELEDPIEINGHIYCDKCVPEVVAYRFKMREVAEITNDLVIASQPSPLDSIPLNTLTL